MTESLAQDGRDAASALQRAAMRMSSEVQRAVQVGKFPQHSVYRPGEDDALGAAPALPKPSRNAFDRQPPPKPTPREVPPAVVAAAAAVGQAIAASQPPGAALPAAAPLPAAAAQVARPGGPQAGSSRSGGGGGGASIWCAAPAGVKPESRLAVDLPEVEFSYIERPWSHFLTRWAAIVTELQRIFSPQTAFSLLDLGSCSGFFCLQAAAAFPKAVVVGVEGSVGVGNGTTGVGGTQEQIIETKAIQTHMKWLQKLALPNCLVAPDVWDYQRVCALASSQRYLCDVMLSLSVVHHIDNVSVEQYEAAGLSRVEGSVSLMAKLLQLAPRHFVELPDRPWMDHVFVQYGTAQGFLNAVVASTGQQWQFLGPLVLSEWYGKRELWLLELVGGEDNDLVPTASLPQSALEAIFPRLLSSSSSVPLAPSPVGEQRRPPVPAAAPAKPAAGPRTQAEIGAGLLMAPTALLAAHLQLRDAMVSAEALLREMPKSTANA